MQTAHPVLWFHMLGCPSFASAACQHSGGCPPKSESLLPWSVGARSEATEDADVIELLVVAVSRQREQKGPLEAHEAPNTRQVEAQGVRRGCGGKGGGSGRIAQARQTKRD